MQVIYAREPLEKSIFLAGPTPRSPEVSSWRPRALAELKHTLKFEGTVFVPEDRDWATFVDGDGNADAQVSWEWEGLNQSTIVVFWVPREIKDMPAFTTNMEFGLLVASGKCVLGFPPDADKMGYLNRLAKRYNVPVFSTLLDTLAEAVARTKRPYGRFD